MNKERIYRELNYAEAYRSQLKVAGPDIVGTFIKIKSDIDFLSMYPAFKNSFDEVLKENDHLRCTIAQDDVDVNKFYYVYLSPEKLEGIFKFITYESPRNDGEQSVWNLFEKEMNIKFRAGEPLWRARLIRVQNADDTFDYCMFVFGHHAITDGLNTFSLFLRLLVNVTKKDLQLNRNDYEEAGLLFPVKPISCLKLKSTEKHNDGVFSTIDNEFYASATLSEIEDSNRGVRAKKFRINEPMWSAISSESKRRRVKLTCIFDLLAAFALKKTIRSVSQDADTNVKSGITVNLRPYLGIDTEQMGIWLTHCENEYGASVDYLLECDRSVFSKQFWEMAKQSSDKLEAFTVKENAARYYEDQQKMFRYIFLNQDRLLSTSNAKKTYYVTYINHDKSIPESFKQHFDLVENYSGSFNQTRNKKNLASIFVSGLDRYFCLTIIHRVEDLSTEAVDAWAKNMHAILEKLF